MINYYKVTNLSHINILMQKVNTVIDTNILDPNILDTNNTFDIKKELYGNKFFILNRYIVINNFKSTYFCSYDTLHIFKKIVHILNNNDYGIKKLIQISKFHFVIYVPIIIDRKKYNFRFTFIRNIDCN